MTIKLTEGQIQSILNRLSKDQVIDYLSEDVEKSVDIICTFIYNYVDSKVLQDKLKAHFPPVQMELFSN